MSTPTVTGPRTIVNPLIKDVVTFLETSEESGGRRTLVEIELAPGGGNPPHRHPTFAEHFHVLEGTLTVLLGKREVEVPAGESVVAPMGCRHRFANPTDEPVRFQVELQPGSTGFERSLQIGYGLAADGLTTADGVPKNLLHMGVLLEMSELVPVGALRALTPFAGMLARRARRTGVEAELVERYCLVGSGR